MQERAPFSGTSAYALLFSGCGTGQWKHGQAGTQSPQFLEGRTQDGTLTHGKEVTGGSETAAETHQAEQGPGSLLGRRRPQEEAA